MVHQREAREAGLVGGPRDARQPAGRVLAPGEPGHLEHDVETGARSAASAAARRRRPASRPASSVGDPRDPVPALGVEQRGQRAGTTAAARSAPGRAPAGPAPRCGCRHSAGGVEADHDRGQPCARARSSQPPASYDVQARACPRRWSAPAAPGRRRSGPAARTRRAEASRSWRPLPTTPRRSSEETISADRYRCPRPRRLAGPGGPDEHHERRVGEGRVRRHAGSLAPAAGRRPQERAADCRDFRRPGCYVRREAP